MNKLDITYFLRIQTPLMILAVFMLFMGLLFYVPDWILGIENVYPPFPIKSSIQKISEVVAGKA